MTEQSLNVLLIGIGRIGKLHADAYQSIDAYSLVGICGREHQRAYATSKFPDAEFHLDGEAAIAAVKPDVVCISTHLDSHERFARAAIDNGAHVFLEKPAAETLEETRALFEFAASENKKIVVGYVRKHDPLWQAFVETSKDLGSPVVVRFCLDQPSFGEGWDIHKSILKRSTLTFDCAVHYVDMMSKICGAPPVRVTAGSVRLHDDPQVNDNYGFLHVEFTDGSLGSYDSVWGPMASRATDPVTNTTGPGGSVSIVGITDDAGTRKDVVVLEPKMSADQPSNNRQVLELKSQDDAFVVQQQFLLERIRDDKNMDEHYEDVITSMRIVIAADESAASGEPVRF